MRTAIALAAALVLSLVATAGVVARSGAPAPPGSAADGRVEPASLPERIGVVGPDGRDVLCNGKLLTVAWSDLVAPPPAPAGSPETGARRPPAASDHRTRVPRCGPNGKAVWVAVD
jgi:hypothetical protein